MNYKKIILCFAFCLIIKSIFCQAITGYWHGTIGAGKKLELKLIANGDSITGTSYYYESKNNYSRYKVKGYFNPKTNAIIWWDAELYDSKQPKIKMFSVGDMQFTYEANLNCPGGGVMQLLSEIKKRNSKDQKIVLNKVNKPIFDDAWNDIIDNWFVGGNNRQWIDSIKNMVYEKPIIPTEQNKTITKVKVPIQNQSEAQTTIEKKIEPVVILEVPVKLKEKDSSIIAYTKKESVLIDEKKEITENKKENTLIEFLDLNKPNSNKTNNSNEVAKVVADIKKDDEIKALKIENNTKSISEIKKDTSKILPQILIKPTDEIVAKYVERKKLILTEIPIADSIEFNFYDNAEVDGDSISLFLDDKLLIEHIRLTDKPFVVKLNKKQIENASELTMVAENLGAIPPNTSYMVAYINGKKYDATLSSTEHESAVIKFIKPPK